MAKKRLEEGDIFYVKHNGYYFFGKIILNVNKRILKLEPENIRFRTFTGCNLACVYKGIYQEPNLESQEFIIPETYFFEKYFYTTKYKIDWVFVRNEPINFKQIDFPESLISDRDVRFRKGELYLQTEITNKEYFDGPFNIQTSINGSYLSLIDYACYYQGRKDLMDVKSDINLDSSDLRMVPEKRKIIYNQIGEDMNQSYYEMALKHGLDFGRFYENN